MSIIGTVVHASDLVNIEVPDNVTAVWGETWEGEPVIRGLRAGWETLLRGEFGKGFDRHGPTAGICGECGEVLLSETTGHHTLTIQRHYSAAHGQNLALLP